MTFNFPARRQNRHARRSRRFPDWFAGFAFAAIAIAALVPAAVVSIGAAGNQATRCAARRKANERTSDIP
jgi:solute:Na+ symporter, SSS family